MVTMSTQEIGEGKGQHTYVWVISLAT